MPQLVIFRLLQGLGAGGLIPLALTIIGEIYTLAERTRMQAVFSSVWGVASIAGPLVGGIITDAISWRWVFYLNVPIGLVAAAVVQRTLPGHESRGGKVSIDWWGGLLLFLSTSLLLVAVTEASPVWGACALASMMAFTYAERRASDPVMPFALFRNRTMAVATTVGFLAGMALYGAIAFLPLFVQITTGGSATNAGQVLTPLYLTWVLSSIVAARLLLRIGARASTVLGTAAVFMSCTALSWLTADSSRTFIMVDMALMGTGLGFVMLSLLLSVQHSVRRTELGVATSTSLFARSIGGAVGVAIMGAIMAAGLGESARLPSSVLEGAGLADLGPELRQRLSASLRHAFASGAIASGIAVVAAFWVPHFDGKSQPAVEEVPPSEAIGVEAEVQPLAVND
jgi:MFS family permease